MALKSEFNTPQRRAELRAEKDALLNELYRAMDRHPLVWICGHSASETEDEYAGHVANFILLMIPDSDLREC